MEEKLSEKQESGDYPDISEVKHAVHNLTDADPDTSPIEYVENAIKDIDSVLEGFAADLEKDEERKTNLENYKTRLEAYKAILT